MIIGGSGLILGVGALAIGFYVVAQYNKGVGLKNYVEEAFSTMDVYLKKRWDVISNLVESVKGYAKHEATILNELRSKSYGSMSNDEKIEANAQISAMTPKIFALAEAYPDLKANENFGKLMDNLKAIEDDIAHSRKYYNGTVRELNNYCSFFPTNILSSMFGITKAKFFEISEGERENVKVEF